jgi:hypothetical protein
VGGERGVCRRWHDGSLRTPRGVLIVTAIPSCCHAARAAGLITHREREVAGRHRAPAHRSGQGRDRHGRALLTP